VMHLVASGDMVENGQPVAELRDIWGRPIGDGVMRSEYDGFVIGRSHGILFYPGEPVLSMAVPLDGEMVVGRNYLSFHLLRSLNEATPNQLS